MTPRAAAAKFAELVNGLDGPLSAVDHEPGKEGLPRLPCVTMLYRGSARISQGTGGYVDLEPTWDVILYVELKEYERAQHELEELVDYLLAAAANWPTLEGESSMAHLTDELNRPIFVHGEGNRQLHMYKRLKLTARMD